MADQRLERQASLPIRPPRSVAVIGCGGVGSWIAFSLAMAGVKELWLFDQDTVAENNLNRALFQPSAVAKVKSEALADTIRIFRPDCRIFSMGNFEPHIIEVIDHFRPEWLVCSTDTAASRRMVEKYSQEHYIHYIEAAAEGDTGSATGVSSDWSTDQETEPGYASVPVWLGPCAMGALIAVSYILHGRGMNDKTLRIGWGQTPEGIQGVTFYDSKKG